MLDLKKLFGEYKGLGAALSLGVGLFLIYSYMSSIGLSQKFLWFVGEYQFAFAVIVTAAFFLFSIFALLFLYPALLSLLLSEYVQTAPNGIKKNILVWLVVTLPYLWIPILSYGKECWYVWGLLLLLVVLSIDVFALLFFRRFSEKTTNNYVVETFLLLMVNLSCLVPSFVLTGFASSVVSDGQYSWVASICAILLYSTANTAYLTAKIDIKAIKENEDATTRRVKGIALLSAIFCIPFIIYGWGNITEATMKKIGIREDVGDLKWYKLESGLVGKSIFLESWPAEYKHNAHGEWYVKAYSPFSTAKLVVLCSGILIPPKDVTNQCLNLDPKSVTLTFHAEEMIENIEVKEPREKNQRK